MNGTFLAHQDITRTRLDWGELAWISSPSDTRSKQISMAVVNLEPGCGHDFHRHPRQEEVLYLLSGEVEQWLEKEKRTLRKGDVAFVAPGVVHGSFNCGQETATFLVVLSPSVGEGGYESEEVADQAPWNSLRKS